MGSVEAAKAYLMKANAEGCNLYDHLAEVMSKLLSEKPADALAQLEAISAEVKATKFVPGPGPAKAGTAPSVSLSLSVSPSPLPRSLPLSLSVPQLPSMRARSRGVRSWWR